MGLGRPGGSERDSGGARPRSRGSFPEPRGHPGDHVAESQPWSVAEWAVAPRFDDPRATVLVLLLG